jgi:hypothetical protein
MHVLCELENNSTLFLSESLLAFEVEIVLLDLGALLVDGLAKLRKFAHLLLKYLL